LDDPGFQSREVLGPASLLFNWDGRPFPGIKLSGREANPSPSCAEVKNEWSCATAVPSVFLLGVLKEQLYLLLGDICVSCVRLFNCASVLVCFE
jgi:hypothetical protein